MSHLLWKYYLEDDVEKFESLLSNGSQNIHQSQRGNGPGIGYTGSLGALVGSPGTEASPRTTMKPRKPSGQGGNIGGQKGQVSLGRTELNSRDHMGCTVLHRVVSAAGHENALRYAVALLDHPAVDLYAQDKENGWTALHRALYFGNAAIARILMERDAPKGYGLIKIKDHEGNTAFDVYNASIARRTLQDRISVELDLSDEEDASVNAEDETVILSSNCAEGDELFAFGSNKNLSLGFGDEDDRQHPERIGLKRPDHLLYRFYKERFPSSGQPSAVTDLPTLIRNRPIIIQDVSLSKLHSAVLTTDPEANLYICGFGPGGRLGTGDETTRFNYVCIEGGAIAGKRIVSIALGQNHSMAVSDQGEIFTWGMNTWCQLGYSLPKPAIQDEEPVNCTPRQIFGPLKREIVVGVAASAIHSVAHTLTSLYTWGKNEGQLGLMDSDSRSLEVQSLPRKVAASLFSSPITMVSAINRATICLLANHSVCVFTNYGYNYVKFPLYENFSNYHLNSTALTTRYEAENHICEITSGGDTIAAISSRGDLFTLNVSNKPEPGPTAASTTNPAKIKSALSPPQRIWSLRKGHWDGIKSVGVGENGSVIICTQAGAVWRRVKRAKIKDAFASGTGDFRKKDFKFQRVPGLTNVVAVRSNVFGSYAAVRKDCDVTKTQILVEEQHLWEDLAPMLSFRDLAPSQPALDDEDTTPRFWTPAIPKDGFNPLKRAVLVSPDLESDMKRLFWRKDAQQEGYDAEICSSLSECSIPVHTFMFAARSAVFREALSEYRRNQRFELPDLLRISTSDSGQLSIEFQGVDFLTLFNLVLYTYGDAVVDVWHFTRHAPNMAFRYRQVRVELMKVAARLGMTRLEAAVRLMNAPERSLNLDIMSALKDPTFFDNGDAIIELDGDEVLVHSILLRQRCPFFDGLFKGRAGGQWLASRRELDPDLVRIDMKHIDPSTFELVLRYLYADVGVGLFDEVVASDIDEFSEIVMDVLSVSNELMLDRLSEICQQIIGRFVNTRNICHVLNEVAPCSVTTFKDAGLEYICLQLECMLENHLLDGLDDYLLLELDDVVCANQRACLPFAKSGRAEALLHERHPSLAGMLDEDRQRLLRDVVFRSMLRDEDQRPSSSYRARVGSLDDMLSSSPQENVRRRSKPARNAPFSPAIRPKDSATDLMFDMDEEDTDMLYDSSPRQKSTESLSEFAERLTPSEAFKSARLDSKGKMPETQQDSLTSSPISQPPPHMPTTRLGNDSVLSNDNTYSPNRNKSSSMPWSSPSALSSSKLDMREIMAQASSNRTSTLSLNLSAQRTSQGADTKATTTKLSQKERRKQQQQVLQQSMAQAQSSPNDGKSSPWQTPIARPITSLKSVLDPEPKDKYLKEPPNNSGSPGTPISLSKRRTASPDTRFAGQRRNNSNGFPDRPGSSTPSKALSRPGISVQPTRPTPLVPHSKSYNTPPSKAEPSLQLSMADIIGQQKLEQDLIKEAVAKRSLQEIQEEQAFQEWWDQESKRAQEGEARRSLGSGRVNDTSRGKQSKAQRGGGQRGRGDLKHNVGRGRGGRGRGQGTSSGTNTG